MQNSSEFQYIAIDQIHESTTNPRKTFEETKLAESIRSNGLIQPITVRPNDTGFEIVAGARRFRAAQLAEMFSLPARIVAIDDTRRWSGSWWRTASAWTFIPTRRRRDFNACWTCPAMTLPLWCRRAARVQRTSTPACHSCSLCRVWPRRSPKNASPQATQTCWRVPQDVQATAYEQCWRKDWQDKEQHLLPAKHLASWIQTNLYLNLADAPFDKQDDTLNPDAGACTTCPKRSGFNTSLFADVQGDQCLDGSCYQAKISLYIDRELEVRPNLVQIETTWRPAKEQRPGVLHKHSYHELEEPENPDAEPSCPNVRTAMIVFGRHAGTTLTVCTDSDCPVHDPDSIARRARQNAEHPAPVMVEPEQEETEEEAAERMAAYEKEKQQHEAEQKQREEERKAEFERQQMEYEAEQKKREKLQKARTAAFERILNEAPAVFTATQLRVFLTLLVQIDSYNFLEEVANHFATDEDHDKSEQEIISAALNATADDRLTGFALRLVLTEHTGIPREGEPDPLTEAAAVFLIDQTEPKDKKRMPIQPVKASARKPKAKAA